MLKLYTARENIDKERFIYENIKGDALVIVPDQYTLVAEEQALKYLNISCLYDVEIMSMNRLGLKILTEKGKEAVPVLDKYGRFMLITKIVKSRQNELNLYRNLVGKTTFITMLNDFISDFKQQDCTIDELREMLSNTETDKVLKAKLSELEVIVEDYERTVKEKNYADSEDYISRYVDLIQESDFVNNKNIWIYGYDSITPKLTNAIFELAERAKSVNFIINKSDFNLGEQLTQRLREDAFHRGVGIYVENIGQEYRWNKSETMQRIEAHLWSDEPVAEYDFFPKDLTLLRAANPYYEAESAAAYILHLIRDLGYRFNEIQVIANDEDVMQPIIRRTLEEYGLPVFLDSARDITDSAAVSFIVNQLWFLLYGKSSRQLFSMLKTGLAGIEISDVEDIENYARLYHIKGNMWYKDFKYGEDQYGTEAFENLNAIRKKIIGPLVELESIVKCEKVVDFITAFKYYLDNTLNLGERVSESARRQEEMGLGDEAQRIVQSYEKAVNLLDQIVEIMGDEDMNLAEFTEIYVTGLTNVEVGVIPPTKDGLSIGTMIRTRPRPIRAAIVLGANEGILPMQLAPEGLFSVDEKEYFRDINFAIGGLDDIKREEENTAMYRMLSKPSEKLYISWSMTDADGKEEVASPAIDALIELFPRIEKDGLICKDIVSVGWGESVFNNEYSLRDGKSSVSDTINSTGETMRHFINHIKDRNTSAEPDDITDALFEWYERNEDRNFARTIIAAQDENDPKPLGKKAASDLFAGRDGTLKLSPSSINSYFSCPFKFFIDRGLRPQEEREFASDPRAIGDVYHECLMRIAERILADRNLGFKLSEFSDRELEKIITDELEKIAADYGGGLFISTAGEEFRMERIKEICVAAVRAMAEQLSSGSLIDASLEAGFSIRGKFKPIELEVGDNKIYVEGKIDRADLLRLEEGNRIRIIDYKTGGDTLNLNKMRSGYNMQLMIYMISALSGGLEPAGMFYFNIKDYIETFNDKSKSQIDKIMDKETSDAFKLRGVYVDEPGVLEAMPEGVLAKTKGGKVNREEFEIVRQDVVDRIQETASSILNGTISIRPLKEGNRLVCNYCNYKPVCKRDREYVRNTSREICEQKGGAD